MAGTTDNHFEGLNRLDMGFKNRAMRLNEDISGCSF